MDHGAISKAGNKVNDTAATRETRADADSSQGVPSNPGTATDTVNLTGNAKLLERLEKSLASLSDIDDKRIAEVKSAIESGNYQIDADAIADALIRFDRSFGK